MYILYIHILKNHDKIQKHKYVHIYDQCVCVYIYIYMYSQPKDGPKVLVWERSPLLVGLRGWTFSGSETMPFSPSARWGLLDFISACPPLSFRPSVHPSFLVLPCPSFSFLRRTSTASSRSQCSPPAPNSKLRIRAFPAGPPRPAPDRSVLFPAGPQPRAPEQSVPRRTSNARKNLIRYGIYQVAFSLKYHQTSELGICLTEDFASDKTMLWVLQWDS